MINNVPLFIDLIVAGRENERNDHVFLEGNNFIWIVDCICGL